MPRKSTIERARKDKRAGKAPSTQAGEFVKEEMHKVGKGKRSPRSRRQAIAIGLSQARRKGVDLPPPEKGKAKEATRRRAERDRAAGDGGPLSKSGSKRAKKSPARSSSRGTPAGRPARTPADKPARRHASRRSRRSS